MRKFKVTASSNSIIPKLSSPWNKLYKTATKSEFYDAGYDTDYMIRPEAFDNYSDLEYVGWAIGKDEDLRDLLDDYAGIGAVCLAKDSSGRIIPVEVAGDRIYDLDFNEISDAIDY